MSTQVKNVAGKAGAKQPSAFDILAKANPSLAAAITGSKVVDIYSINTHTAESSAPILEPCQILCRVAKIRLTDSFTADENGTQKEVEAEWVTPTPQVIVMFVDAKAPRHKTHFFNLAGFMSYSEVEQMLADNNQSPSDFGIIESEKGSYALMPTADGKYDRIPDEKKSADCIDIFSRFATAINMDGMSVTELVEAVQQAIEEKEAVELTVKFDFGKSYLNAAGEAARSIEPVKFLRSMDRAEEEEAEEEFEAEEI